MSLDHVRVHYNSPQPAQLNALAYAQGSDIHLAPGQERHLPHEAWHVVQQAQGRVRPTLQMAGGVAVSDNAGLEREADVIGAQAAEVLLDAPAMERVTSAAPPTGAVVQRTIRIGTTLYTTDYARYFRRELMITLAQLDFPEKGTGAMWERVNDWLKDGKENIFADFRTLIANLYDQRLIVKRMSAGAAMGPRNLGDRPAFTTGVKKLLELSKGESQARRHVISSSTLGRAIEMVPAKLETLNAWLLRHELSAQPSTSSGMLDVRAAKIRIWEHVHNHLGNLWVGPSMPNSAIGFIRGPILRAVEGARKHMAEKDSDTVPLDSLIELLPKSPWRNELFAETWNNVRATLIDQLRAYAGSGDQVEGVAAVALMVEWIRNADLDLPSAKLDEGYFNRLSSIYGRLVYPTEELFAAKGALDDFLGLGLGPKASPSASSKKDSWSPMETSDAPKLPADVPQRIHGAGRIQDVSGEGMNCLIRSLLVASGREAEDSVVSALRTYLLSQGVADQADMLDLAGDAGAVLISFMQAQGHLEANRGLVVYTPATPNQPIRILDGANPICLWLSDNHFCAIVHE
jgi:hypothetical protein